MGFSASAFCWEAPSVLLSSTLGSPRPATTGDTFNFRLSSDDVINSFYPGPAARPEAEK